ncbi:hypothetical protein BY458DRAFT_517081 [Sporodiniella umbellata]|nr:hypothetical protein BY458DRAFT_517081 [Sporodiniella umbellata]
MENMSTCFADNFWESFEKNGITILLDRMRGAKQTCERFKSSYEARALLEEEYSKTLSQISQKQKASCTESGCNKVAMDRLQEESQSIADSHMQLSCHLKDNIISPLSKLITKQKKARKELQSSVQKLYNKRQLQAHFVRKAHQRHNQEIEKANLLVEQKISEEDKQVAFKSAQPTIEKLKNVYDEGLKDLTKLVEEWNSEWRRTCECFEKLEQERLEFFASNLSNYANLMIGCSENEIKAYERANDAIKKCNPLKDLETFVQENKSTHISPTPMDYVKLHAYNEANKDKEGMEKSGFQNSMDHEEHSDTEDGYNIKRGTDLSNLNEIDTLASVIMNQASDIVQPDSVMMVGKMEVYGSEEEDDSDSESVYTTDLEEEKEPGVQASVEADKNETELTDTKTSATKNTLLMERAERQKPQSFKRPNIYLTEDRENDTLPSHQNTVRGNSVASPIEDGEFSSILLKKGLSTKRRPSLSNGQQRPFEMNGETLAEKVNRVISSGNNSYDESLATSSREEAATELDNMLRELDNNHWNRPQNKIRPTASASSPSIVHERRGSYFSKADSQRVSPIDTHRGSRRFSRDFQQRVLSPTPNSPSDSLSQSTLSSSQGDFYDPFYSLSSSSRSGHTVSSDGSVKNSKSPMSAAPTAQVIYERMLKNGNMDSYRRHQRRSSVGVDTGSANLRESLGNTSRNIKNTASVDPAESKEQFVDFAIAQYDYEAADEGEISFYQGDLLGIISKGDTEDEQGWWEASLLDKLSQKVVRTGLVPSNFIETASRA